MGLRPTKHHLSSRELAKGRNFVVVKADNTRRPDEIPTVNTDWWNYGGITRDVLLAELPATYIKDYKVQLAKGDARRIEGYVQLAGADKTQTVTLSIPEANIKTTVQTDATGPAPVLPGLLEPQGADLGHRSEEAGLPHAAALLRRDAEKLSVSGTGSRVATIRQSISNGAQR